MSIMFSPCSGETQGAIVNYGLVKQCHTFLFAITMLKKHFLN
jgi:hypothetical protein